MDTKTVQEHLKVLGWPIDADGSFGPRTREAVSDFQRGFGWRDLLIDGMAGPATWNALTESVSRGGRCANYFTFAEFKSKGNGWIKVDRVLVRALDRYREAFGPTRVVSGYRDPAYNRSIGSVANSQHTYGGACDLDPIASFNAVRNLGVFSGIGIVRSTGKIAHVDGRGQGQCPATTPGTPQSPTIWYYA